MKGGKMIYCRCCVVDEDEVISFDGLVVDVG